MNPIEGVDYLFDRYAFLGLTPEASPEEIKQAIKKRLVENHPDHLRMAGDEIKRAAQKTRTLTLKCQDILSDPERKARYDELLKKFQEEAPLAIRADGQPVIDISRPQAALDMLLRGETLDLEEADEKARILLQYDEKKLAKTKTLFEESPHSDTAKELYKEELTKQYVYLLQRERQSWAQAGIINADDHDITHTQYPDQLPEFVAQQIERAKEEFLLPRFEAHNKALTSGLTSPVKFLPLNTDSSTALQKATTISTDLQVQVLERFTDRSKQVLEASKERERVLEEFISLTSFEFVSSVPNPPHAEIIIIVRDEALTSFHVTIEAERVENTHDYDGLSLDDVRSQTASAEHDIILVFADVGDIFAPLMQATHICNRYLEGELKPLSQEKKVPLRFISLGFTVVAWFILIYMLIFHAFGPLTLSVIASVAVSLTFTTFDLYRRYQK